MKRRRVRIGGLFVYRVDSEYQRLLGDILLAQYGQGADGRVRWQLRLGTKRVEPLFSERMGYRDDRRRRVRVGRYHLTLWVNPNRKAARA